MTNNMEIITSNTNLTNKFSEGLKLHPIRLYLNGLDVKDRSKDMYERYILYFFSSIYENINTIEDITKEMIEGVNPLHTEYYKQSLENNNESKNTVLLKIKVVKYMYTYLINQYTTNINGGFKWLLVNPFANTKVKIKEQDVKSYDSISDDELVKLFKIATASDMLLYKTAVITGVRLNELLSLTIKDIIKRDDTWCITGIGKGGKPFCEAILEQIYEGMLSLVESDDEKIFKSHASNVYRRLIKNLLKIGVSQEEIDERGLCFHSFKKSCVVKVGEMTNGNIAEMLKKSKHSHVKTMLLYNKKKENKSNDIGLRMTFTNEKIDIKDKLTQLSKEELIDLIMNCDDYTKKLIQNKLK